VPATQDLYTLIEHSNNVINVKHSIKAVSKPDYAIKSGYATAIEKDGIWAQINID